MINTLKKIFGLGPKVDYKELIKNGAQVIDVRTSGEYASGHIKGSVNIPLNSISAHVKKIKKRFSPYYLLRKRHSQCLCKVNLKSYGL